MIPLQKQKETTINSKKDRFMVFKNSKQFLTEFIAVLLTLIIFGVPFYFVIINAVKNQSESALLNMKWPSSFHIIDNLQAVFSEHDGMLFRAFYNSSLLTVFSLILLVIVGSMAGFVLQRKISKASSFFNFLIIAGLIIPPAVVPTIWVLNLLGLFKTMPGIVLIEVALSFPFTVLLYKSFMVTIPREIDEAALIDGCGSIRLFFNIIFPLLKPVTSTIVVLTAVNIYNDFVNPLYFYPGAENVTLQLTLYNFTSMYQTEWNLLFTNILVISLPMLILFLFFSKKIVAGMTAGAIK